MTAARSYAAADCAACALDLVMALAVAALAPVKGIAAIAPKSNGLSMPKFTNVLYAFSSPVAIPPTVSNSSPPAPIRPATIMVAPSPMSCTSLANSDVSVGSVFARTSSTKRSSGLTPIFRAGSSAGTRSICSRP